MERRTRKKEQKNINIKIMKMYHAEKLQIQAEY